VNKPELQAPIAIPPVTHTTDGLDGVAWNVLGQVYIPKEVTDDRFTWLAVFPEETFVPPHTHATQDEFLLPLDGVIEVVIGGRRSLVQQGQVGHLPRGVPHGFYNNTGKPVTALFWATPAGQLVELYRKLHNVGSAARATSIAPTCGVVFEPPVSSAA
jgi:mannose-6-phosphate isomerase-like protein (cupin superfamily)